MPVFNHKNGTITQVWGDVETIEEFSKKYPSVDQDDGFVEVSYTVYAGQMWNGKAVSNKARTLDELKLEAIEGARTTALNVRKSIIGTATVERALGWVLKAQFAKLWAEHQQTPDDKTVALAAVAQQGFELEAGFTGEDATAIRDRSIQKAGAFFLANQIVEGMERLTENDIAAVTSLSDLQAKISELRGLETQALTQLETIARGGTNA